MKVLRFDSVEEYAGLIVDDPQCLLYGGGYRSFDWDNGISIQQACEKAIHGDPSLANQYSDTVKDLIHNFQMEQDVKQAYMPSIAGTRVSVPEYLGGSPKCLRRRMPREFSTRSVSIYVSTTCSAGISADKMIKRGCTILALLEYLQMSQVAVELFLLAETHGRTDGDLIQVIRVESHPLDLSVAGFAIAHPAFARHLTYSYAQKADGFNGQWGRSHHRKDYVQLLSKVIGMEEQDIYVPAPVLWDGEIMSRPQTWLEKRIQEIKTKSSVQ